MEAMSAITGFFEHLSQQILSNPLFEPLGVFFIFIWSVIPSAKTIPVEIFIFALLEAGASPIVLVIIASVGAITGDFVLYLLGRGVFRAVKRRKKDMARADHLLRKYRLPIFFVTPFFGLIGDTVVFVAGLERIGFKKMLPFLAVGQFSRFTIGMLAILGIIQLPEFLGI